MNSPKKVVTALQSDFFGVLHTLTKEQIEGAVKYLSDAYYNDGVSLISDENFDRLRETYIKQFGQTDAITTVVAIIGEAKKSKTRALAAAHCGDGGTP
jgi:NAD-dependent DNA ligase